MTEKSTKFPSKSKAKLPPPFPRPPRRLPSFPRPSRLRRPLPFPRRPLSPLAGKVVSIDTKVGAAVKDGDQILTIEAMKMNTYIYANKAGTISAINVSVGDGVEEGQVLAVIS